MGGARNHVAAFAGTKRTDVNASHAAAVTGNTKHLNNGIAGCSQCVMAGIRLFACVSGLTFECHVILGSAEQTIRSGNNFTGIGHERNMASKEKVCIINNTGGGNG